MGGGRIMVNIQLPKYNQYKCFDFYYSESNIETFNIGDEFIYAFYVGDGIVDIRKIDVDLFYIYIYFKIQAERGKKNIHTHFTYNYNSSSHKKLSEKICVEIDKVKNNMLCKRPKRLLDLTEEIY